MRPGVYPPVALPILRSLICNRWKARCLSVLLPMRGFPFLGVFGVETPCYMFYAYIRCLCIYPVALHIIHCFNIYQQVLRVAAATHLQAPACLRTSAPAQALRAPGVTARTAPGRRRYGRATSASATPLAFITTQSCGTPTYVTSAAVY